MQRFIGNLCINVHRYLNAGMSQHRLKMLWRNRVALNGAACEVVLNMCGDKCGSNKEAHNERQGRFIATIKKHGTLDIGCITEAGGEENATQ